VTNTGKCDDPDGNSNAARDRRRIGQKWCPGAWISQSRASCWKMDLAAFKAAAEELNNNSDCDRLCEVIWTEPGGRETSHSHYGFLEEAVSPRRYGARFDVTLPFLLASSRQAENDASNALDRPLSSSPGPL
jgi:hypothetical protein